MPRRNKDNRDGRPLLVFLPVVAIAIATAWASSIKAHGEYGHTGGNVVVDNFAKEQNNCGFWGCKAHERTSKYDPAGRDVKISDAIDQGNCSAAGFIAYSIAYDARRAIHVKEKTLEAYEYTSPQFMLDCFTRSGQKNNDVDNCDANVSPGRLKQSFVQSIVNKHGIPLDKNVPWKGRQTVKGDSCSLSGVVLREKKIASVDPLFELGSDEKLTKTKLTEELKKHPVVVHMKVFSELLAYDASENNGILEQKQKEVKNKDSFSWSSTKMVDTMGVDENFVGYHTLVATKIGKDSLKEYVLLQNTWGVGYGEHGYVKIESDLFFDKYLVKDPKDLPSTSNEKIDTQPVNMYVRRGIANQLQEFDFHVEQRVANYVERLVERRVSDHRFEPLSTSPFAVNSKPSPDGVQFKEFEEKFVKGGDKDPSFLSVAIKAAKEVFVKMYPKENVHFDMLLEADQTVVAGRRIHLMIFAHKKQFNVKKYDDVNKARDVHDTGVFEIMLWFPPKIYSSNHVFEQIKVPQEYVDAASHESSYLTKDKSSTFNYKVLGRPRWRALPEVKPVPMVFVNGNPTEALREHIRDTPVKTWGDAAKTHSFYPIAFSFVGSVTLLLANLVDTRNQKIAEGTILKPILDYLHGRKQNKKASDSGSGNVVEDIEKINDLLESRLD